MTSGGPGQAGGIPSKAPTGPDKEFFIKPGYRINLSPTPFLDSEDDAVVYQVDVYRYAAECVRTRKLASVLDLGCGYGLKLAELIRPLGVAVTGIDGKHAIGYCRTHHEFGRWFVDDIECSGFPASGPFDLIISSDVIEHLVDPDKLLDYIRRASHRETLVVLSTPERDLRRGKDSMGPPENRAHVREWNRTEFAAYLRDRGMDVLDHRIVDLKAGMATCQVVLCRTGRD